MKDFALGLVLKQRQRELGIGLFRGTLEQVPKANFFSNIRHLGYSTSSCSLDYGKPFKPQWWSISKFSSSSSSSSSSARAKHWDAIFWCIQALLNRVIKRGKRLWRKRCDISRQKQTLEWTQPRETQNVKASAFFAWELAIMFKGQETPAIKGALSRILTITLNSQTIYLCHRKPTNNGLFLLVCWNC